jgi:hypothetical protein
MVNGMQTIYIVFDRLPGGPGDEARFVEVEDENGSSVRVPWGAHPTSAGLMRLGPFSCDDRLFEPADRSKAHRRPDDRPQEISPATTAALVGMDARQLPDEPGSWFNPSTRRTATTYDLLRRSADVLAFLAGGPNSPEIIRTPSPREIAPRTAPLSLEEAVSAWNGSEKA